MPKAATGESPFNLVFGMEAMLPPEVVFPTSRVENFEEGTSEDGLRANLDFIKERRADAHLRALVYKKTIAKLYNRRVNPQSIKLDDLVLRNAKVSNLTHAWGKLAPNWEGPYKVMDVVQDGTYRLTTQEDWLLRTWHISNL